ncbi:MAG: hypothetical protein Kow0026_17810 [Oricola sp.]
MPQMNLETRRPPVGYRPAPDAAPREARCPFTGAMSDGQAMQTVRDWMRTALHCAAGRREFNRGRYMIEIATRNTVPAIRDRFRERLQNGEVTACLYIFNEPSLYAGRADVATAFEFLANQMEPISRLPARELKNGAPLTSSMKLTCPVTNQPTVYDDFECIAFCPQSNDREDPLYDPLLYTPLPAVNMSSDVFAFSRFVADSAMTALGKPVYEVDDAETRRVFLEKCVERWHRLAVSIIQAFERATDTSLCPVHVTGDGRHWIAGHKDPAFAETKKEVHSHELPTVYAYRIIDRWLQYFDDRKPYRANGLARAGIPAKSI